MNDFDMAEGFEDFVDELTSSEKNQNACSIDNPECEACGSWVCVLSNAITFALRARERREMTYYKNVLVCLPT